MSNQTVTNKSTPCILRSTNIVKCNELNGYKLGLADYKIFQFWLRSATYFKNVPKDIPELYMACFYSWDSYEYTMSPYEKVANHIQTNRFRKSSI